MLGNGQYFAKLTQYVSDKDKINCVPQILSLSISYPAYFA